MNSVLRQTPSVFLPVLLCLLLGCVPAEQFRGEAATPAGAHSAREASYLIDGEVFVLRDGQATLEVAPGAASQSVVQVFGEPVSGDLDGDGVPDAALLLVQTTGGSGTFYYVAAALNRGGVFFGTQAVLVGDRIVPEQLAIRHGVVIVDYADRRPGEAMATQPSVAVSKYLVSRGGRLEEIILTDGEVIAAGEVVIGHEVRGFTPCGASQSAWLLGDAPALMAVMTAYHQAMSDASPYSPLFMVLTGRPDGPPEEGFGAEYPAGFRATRVVLTRPGKYCSEAGQ